MDIRVFLRKHQCYNVNGMPCVYQGNDPMSLQFVPGSVSQDWTEYTNDISDRTKLVLTFSAKDDGQDGMTSVDGTTTAGEFSPKKVVSGSLYFEGAAYDYIKSWLVDDVAAPLNQLDVRFVDTTCGEYTGYVIKPSALSWCEGDSLCQYDVTVVQSDDLLNCIQRTVISDNHLGWFGNDTAMQHPRFSYCTEARPNGLLIVEWYLLGVLFGSMIMVMLPIVSVLWIIYGILYVLDHLLLAVGIHWHGLDNLVNELYQIADLTWLKNTMAQAYIESAGCGREHPAPYIRTYIQNVCAKCNVYVDGSTAPLFFAPFIDFDTNSRGVQKQAKNDYYNATYLSAQVVRGIRRFKGTNYFGNPQPDSTHYQTDNAPLLALDQFLDQIKGVFNAEWRLANGTLYIQRKDWWTVGPPLYDFSVTGADRIKLLQGLCYEWNEVQYPAAVKGIYQDDPGDKCAHEAAAQMNGTQMVSFGNTALNPNFYGIMNKTVDLGATKFRLDGASTDYLYDAMQVVCNGQFLAPWLIGQMKTVQQKVAQYCDYALLLQGETTSSPRILIHDPFSGNTDNTNARAVMDVHWAYPNNSGPTTPDVNVNYPWQLMNNAFLPLPWEMNWAHPPQTKVEGSDLTFGSHPPGYYKVTDYLGAVTVANQPAKLVNYPMYFEPHYRDTLWDRFHWIDDPRHNPRLHRNWSCKIDLCCNDLNKLQLLGEGQNAQLHSTVRLDTQYYNTGVITEITVSYDSGQDIGKYIELKGIV